MGDDRLRAALMASRHDVGTFLGRDDVQYAVPGHLGRRPRSTRALVAWLPDAVLLLAADGHDQPVQVIDELPRPQLPDVREGLTWDRWTVGPHRLRVHRGWRAVAGWVEA